MKINFDRDTLLKEISIAQEIIATKTALTILSNVLLSVKDGSLTIKAHNPLINAHTPDYWAASMSKNIPNFMAWFTIDT